MSSMDSYPKAAMERAMKVQDVMLQAMAKKINLVAGSGDTGHQRPAYAAVARALRGRGVQRVVRPAAGQAVASSGAGGDGGEGVRAVPGEVFRSECAALS